MFGTTSEHLRIRLHQFEVREPRAGAAWRALRSAVATVPQRYALHGLVLAVALAAAAANAGA